MGKCPLAVVEYRSILVNGYYRYFEPLRVQIELLLEQNGVQHTFEPRHESFILDISDGYQQSGTTPVIETDSCLIHWKSAHGAANTGHKTKELCGRAFSLRLRLRRKPPRLRELKENKPVLVLDGTFSPDEVGHLVRSGWDAVVPSTKLAEVLRYAGDST